MKFYVATALERAGEARALRDLLLARGHTCMYDWTAHGSVKDEPADTIEAVANAEVKGVQTADVVIVLLPGGRGTHAELGITLGCGVPVLLVGEQPGGTDNRESAFYSASGVYRLRSGAHPHDVMRLAARVARQGVG